jgi:D-methionine transport system substrate-binding protein
MFKFLATVAVAALIGVPALAEDIKVGVTPGEHAQIMEKVKEVAAKKGLNIEILEFSDYVVPNQALADGDLNANSFQHQPYLDNQIADRGFDLVSIGKTITTPMGVYSKKVKNLGELADGATVAIPNDPTNGGRALLVLAKEGLIKVNPDAGLKAGLPMSRRTRRTSSSPNWTPRSFPVRSTTSMQPSSTRTTRWKPACIRRPMPSPSKARNRPMPT